MKITRVLAQLIARQYHVNFTDSGTKLEHTKMTKMKFCLQLLGLLVAISAVASEFRIEPEFFNDIKSWRWSLDKNTSGRSQIIASTNKDNAISDNFILPEAGKYIIWVRAFSFGDKARRARVLINNIDLGAFGDAEIPQGEAKPALRWEKAVTALDLPAGQFTVQLLPLSPYVRIDAIVLTTSTEFVPSDDAKELAKIKELQAPKAAKKATYPKPGFKGNGEPVLVLSGGRPWTGREFGEFLATTGIKTRTLDSRHLNGFGGSPIRDMLSDVHEPLPADYITTEFAALTSYKAVVINNIPANKQIGMFTEMRVAALTKFVQDGGVLILTAGAPSTLGDLLPVEIGNEVKDDTTLFATRPAGENFAFLPEKWQNFDPYYMMKAKKDAQVLSNLVKADGSVVTPYIVMKSLGKGKVLFFNGIYARRGHVAMLYSWAYGRALMAAMIQEATGLHMNPKVLILKEAQCPAPRQLENITTVIKQPQMALADTAANVKIDGNKATFADGAVLIVNENGSLSLTMAGMAKPYALNVEPPKLLLSVAQQKLTSETSEAVDMGQKGVSKTLWKFEKLSADGKYAVLSYTSENGAAMQWIFKSGTLTIDSRVYAGLAQKVKILSAPCQVSSLSSDCKLDIDATFCRRMNCYQPPRGYCEPDMSGKVAADTMRCNFFINSQPFGYINTADGIFAEIIEAPLPVEIRFAIGKGEKMVSSNMTQLIGRRNAPVEGEFFWHLYSKGVEQGHNDYIALWQFARHQLRKCVGLKERMMAPSAGYTNTATAAERDKAIEVAGKLGIPFLHMPLCPSSIDSIDGEKNMAVYAKVKSCGMQVYPWTACDYTAGTGDWIFQNHQDWLMRDEKGGIYAYFVNHRVIDLGNPAFVDWYFKKLKRCFDAGVGYVYLDMGGQAATNVNFAGAESKPGLLNQIPIFKFYHDNNVICGVEGMNPLVIDNYWYREHLYVPMGGKEFATLGANIGTNEDASFTLRYFRTAMYGAFPKFFVDAYAQNFERSPGEIATIDHIAKLLPAIKEAIGYGMPFIRQTPYGTTWINDKGGAVFVWDNVKSLTLELPEGFKVVKTQRPDDSIRDFNPEDLKNVSSETIFIIGRK